MNFFEANNLTSFIYGSLLQDRVDAVEEIVSSSSEKLLALGQVLKKLPDLAKGLCRIQYGKVRQQELSFLLRLAQTTPFCSAHHRNLPFFYLPLIR